MFWDKMIKTMRGLGLTLNEARIYLALLRYGVSSARTVSKVSGVTRQDVYRVMPKLQTKGLVARTLKTPTKFEAIPIEDGVSILMEKRRKKTDELQKKTTVLIKNLRDNNQNFEWKEELEFVVIPAKEAFFRRRKMGIGAERSVDVIVSRKCFLSALYSYGDVTLMGLEKGVRFRVITEKPKERERFPKIWQDIKGHQLFSLRYLSTLPRASVTIYDDKEMLFYLSATQSLEDACLWSNNPSLLAVFHDHFEIMWITAMKTPSYSIDEKQTYAL